jgi:CheY-like chemotaxis protein
LKNLSDRRVLLVDDAKANLDILVEGVKSDQKLSLALNGEMALQVAARTPLDLVLLDIVMPGLDGYRAPLGTWMKYAANAVLEKTPCA